MVVSGIREKYDIAAKDYNGMAFNDGYRAYEVMSLWALENCNKKDPRVLDLGCGTGLSSVEFFKRGFDVVGVDFSTGMLGEAEGFPFVDVICQDLEKPFSFSGRFDIVVLVGVMEFISDPLLLFRRVGDRLNGGGLFLLTVPKKLSRGVGLPIKSYSRGDIEPLFFNAGFKIIGYKSFFGYHKLVGDRKFSIEYHGYLLGR